MGADGVTALLAGLEGGRSEERDRGKNDSNGQSKSAAIGLQEGRHTLVEEEPQPLEYLHMLKSCLFEGD